MEEDAETSSGGICCICSSESPKTLPLFANKIEGDRTLSDIIHFVTNIQIKPEDDFCKQICSDCEHSIYQLDKFKRLYIENQGKLEGILQDTTLQNQHARNDSVKDETCSKPYQCSVCCLQYADIVDLQTHVFSNHEHKHSTKIHIELYDNGDKNENDIKIEAAESPEYTEDNYAEPSFEDLPCEMNMKVDTETYVPKTEKESYKCNLCNSYYKNQKTYRKHVREIHEKLVAVPNAKIEGANVSEMLTKISKYEAKLINTTKFKCKICSTYYKNQKSYRKHVRTKHESGIPAPRAVSIKHECSHCNRQFSKKSKLIIHLRTHEAKGPHICNLCKREFTHKAHLDNHILSIHSTSDGHKCDVCDKSFPTVESLEFHRSSHSNQKKHQCPVCSKSFHMLSTLKDHERVHTGERPYLCPTCGKGFTQNTNLQEHMRRHAGIKPFSCEICPRRFVAKGELAAHMRKHSGAHPFVCVDCGGRFTTSSSLVKHRRTHTGERPYACDLCHMRFAASGTLKNHRRTHTGEKPYKCTHCDKAFVQKNDLVSHTRCHTGERPYVCTTCGQAFRQSSALKTHLKMHPLLNQALIIESSSSFPHD